MRSSREVVIKHTPPELLADIHLKVGIAIEELDKQRPSMQAPFALAWHYLSANSLYRAQGFQRRAAHLAIRSFSYRHAASSFRQLLEQCDAKTPDSERRVSGKSWRTPWLPMAVRRASMKRSTFCSAS